MKNANFITQLRFYALLALAAVLAACSDSSEEEQAAAAGQDVAGATPTTGAVVQSMLEAMGGEQTLQQVDVLVQEGNGFRRHVGQIPETGGEDPVGNLTELTEIIDLGNGRAAFDNVIQVGEGFTQQRTEALTYHQGELIAWGTTEGRPNEAYSLNGVFSWATHNSPEWLLRRNVVTMALAARNADAGQPAQMGMLDGEQHWQVNTTLQGEDVTLYIDPDTSLVSGWQTLDTETMVGDTQATYLLDDYRQVAGVMLPFSLEIVKSDGVYASVQYDDIRVNDSSVLAIFDLPEEVVEQADEVVASEGGWAPLEWNQVTEDVTQVVAFSHHSMVVEFPEFVVVVEAPYSEAQGLTTARMIEENIGKPIRYVTPTHPHYDHNGALRALVTTGASVLAAAGHEEEIRMIVESPHTNPSDILAERISQGAEVGQVEVYEGMTTITGGDKSLELYEVQGIPHVMPMVLAYVPDDGVLFQSDLFFGGPGADAEALYQAIQDLGLEVEQIVGGHGGVFPFSALEEAVAGDE